MLGTILQVLFDLAKYFAPSIVFVDEVESLMSRRDGAGADQHEASRRFKNELLTHLDGLHELSDQQHVCVLGSTNLPWDLDAAFLRRFERKVLLGLPDAAARQQIYARLRAKTVPAQTSDEIGDATREFSGDDIRIAYKAAAMRKIRECVPGEGNTGWHNAIAFALISQTMAQTIRIRFRCCGPRWSGIPISWTPAGCTGRPHTP